MINIVNPILTANPNMKPILHKLHVTDDGTIDPLAFLNVLQQFAGFGIIQSESCLMLLKTFGQVTVFESDQSDEVEQLQIWFHDNGITSTTIS
jgi:hypothetical protein